MFFNPVRAVMPKTKPFRAVVRPLVKKPSMWPSMVILKVISGNLNVSSLIAQQIF